MSEYCEKCENKEEHLHDDAYEMSLYFSNSMKKMVDDNNQAIIKTLLSKGWFFNSRGKLQHKNIQGEFDLKQAAAKHVEFIQ